MPRVLEGELAPAPGARTGDEPVAQPEYDRGFHEGQARGRAEGVAEGRRLERETLATLRVTLSAVMEDLASRQDEWMETLEENISALAVGIARQLLGRELNGDREAIVDMVRRALTQFPVGHEVAIRLNPEDLTLLTSAAEEQTAGARQEARWIADPRIDPGGCVIEGPDRVVDGRLDRALERVYRKLTDV